MSTASDLIGRMERETGQRIDDDNSMAMVGLFGALARVMGESSHREHDDIVAGALIQYQMTPESQQEQEDKKLLAMLLAGGVSPDDMKDLIG